MLLKNEEIFKQNDDQAMIDAISEFKFKQQQQQ